MINGVDVSAYQSTSQLVAAINAGAQFVIVKATEGTGLVDPLHDQHVATARAMHVGLVGHYHFGRHVANAVAEAQFFIAHANPWPGDLVALDAESLDGTWPERVAYVLTFLATLHQHQGLMYDWYTYTEYLASLQANATAAQRAQLSSYPLWIATGGRPAGQPGIPEQWQLHQWSTAGGIDHDVLNPNLTLGEDMPLVAADAAVVWSEPIHFSAGDKSALQALADIYNAVHAVPAPVDVNALAAALAPLVHAQVDPTALATQLAPLVGPQVLAVLEAHPLVPQP